MKTFAALARNIAPILVGALITLTSCVLNEDIVNPAPPAPTPEGTAEVSFMAEMPEPKAVATRAVGSAPENKVDNIYVLVFETGTDGELVYKGKGKIIPPPAGAEKDNRVTFKATLPVGAAYDFMVLANAADALAAINVSDAPAKKRSDVLALTQTLAAGAKWSASPSEMEMTPIPMWGELKNQKLAASDAVAFPLTRMLARVNVECTPKAVGNFKLASVRVYNYSKSGALVPTSFEADGITAKNATEPHGGYATQTGGALVYDGDAITADKACTNTIYLFEAAHNGSTYKLPAGNDDWIDNPCLVVGGRYSADGTNWPDAETYYRIDFIRKSTEGATSAEEWLSLLRNFSYNVTITEVSGEGYDDPDKALRSAPFNMDANILPWNERDMEKVVFDGVFYLSVSQDEFVFQRRGIVSGPAADGSNTVKIKTDYLVNGDPADAGSGWRVDRIEDLGGKPAAWLRLVPGSRPAGWKPNDVNDAYFTFETNPGPTDREANVWIKAGRLEYKIHVVQKILSLDLLDASGNPADEITFVIPHSGSTGTERQQFRVEWTPSALSVAVSGKSPVVYDPFEPGWITGGTAFPQPDRNPTAYSTIPAQPSNAVGKESYTVAPPAVTATELATDPFYERATEYTFTIENLGETIERSVMLHNIHYALVVDTHKYRLDGGTHTVTARSNTDWVITGIEEWLYNVDPKTLPAAERPTSPVMLQLKTYDNLKVGTTGGPNLNGEALAFTVIDNEGGPHDGKWGTVYVTFESTSVPAKFPPQTVPLSFPTNTKLIMGLGYTDVFAVNPGMPSQHHHNSVFQMITSPYNFGSMEESIHKVEGLRVIGYNTQGGKAATPSAQYPDFNWHVNSMTHWLNDDRPDVIFIGDFDSDGFSTHWTENEIRLLDEYVDNGGALILMYNGSAGAGHSSRLVGFLEALLDKPKGSLTVATGGNTVTTDVMKWIDAPATGAWYTLNGTNGAGETDPYYDDPILNGPFGDVRGKYWGAHYHTAGIRTSLLGSDIIPLSNGKAAMLSGGRGNDGYTTIFRHKTKNILFIGAGGFGASYMPGYQETTEYLVGPVALEQSFYRPVARGNWGAGTDVTNRVEVYNSVVLGNAVAWALSVSNHMPPPNGYKNQ